MRIDCHQHFWRIDRGDYDWMTPDVPNVLRRDYLPDDLKPSLELHSVDKTVLVQAAATTAETDFMLSLAERNSTIAGVVGWLDLEAGDFPAQLAHYRCHSKFVGLRPMLQYLADDYILRPKVIEALRHLEELAFPIDLLISARQLPYVLQALEQVPRLRTVVDHIAKPNIKNHEWAPWDQQIAQVAAYPNVYCKLSGMITEANHATWSIEDLRPYIEHVVKSFTLNRVMFGSDWPVCLMAGSYDCVIGALEAILCTLPEIDAAAVFGANAERFYRLG